MQGLKAFHHIIVSSAETMGGFNTGFETVNLHHPTVASRSAGICPKGWQLVGSDGARASNGRSSSCRYQSTRGLQRGTERGAGRGEVLVLVTQRVSIPRRPGTHQQEES